MVCAGSSVPVTRAYDRDLARGHTLRLSGRFEDALAAYERARRAAPDATTAADALLGSAMARRGLALYDAAIASAGEALGIYRRSRDREGEAFALYVRGGARRFLGRLNGASADLERSLALTGSPEARRFTLMALGGLRRMQGDPAASLTLYARARAGAMKAGDRYGAAYAACGIGNAWRMKGDLRRARRWLRTALQGYAAIRDRVSSPYTRFALALLEVAEHGAEPGAVNRARALVAAARRSFSATRDVRGLVYADLAEAVIERESGGAVRARILAGRAHRTAVRLGIAIEAAHAVSIREGPAKARPLYRRLGTAPPRCITALP